MAQRSINWQGPEIWVVTAAYRYEVRVGPPLRDLPADDSQALAVVLRTIGLDGSAVGAHLSPLLLIQDGCVVGPWKAADVRCSREHVVCITPDVLTWDATIILWEQCPTEVMGLLAGHAQRHLQKEQQPPQAMPQLAPQEQQELLPVPFEGTSHVCSPNRTRFQSAEDGTNLEESLEISYNIDEGAYRNEADVPPNHTSGSELELERERPVAIDAEGSLEDDCERDDDEIDLQDAEGDSSIEADRDGGDEETPCEGSEASSRHVVSADEIVRDARNAWLQAKDPNRVAQGREILRGSLQQVFTSQEGTDLRGLRRTDENAPVITEAPARGRWDQSQIVMPVVRQSHASRPSAAPKRGGQLKRASEGGPAGIVASTEHMERLEQLKLRTIRARTAWQTSGALAALRMVLSCDDAALSLSVLRSVAARLVGLGAAELTVGLAIARPLIAPETAQHLLKPLSAMLRAASRATCSEGDRDILLSETREICKRLDALRVTRDGLQGTNFDEQFAFGQALALARDAGRAAWRSLDSGGADQAAQAQAVMRGPAGGRRAW